MTLKKTIEYNEIVEDILKEQDFQELKEELHHGISRYEHCNRVAKCTYYITKKLNFDYISATKAALLHDFYTDEQTKNYTTKETFKMHPSVALKNAKEHFNLSKKEENIIESHMFPACKTLPKYKEAWVTTLVDKSVALYELYRYKAALVMGVYVLFLFNMISIQK